MKIKTREWDRIRDENKPVEDGEGVASHGGGEPKSQLTLKMEEWLLIENGNWQQRDILRKPKLKVETNHLPQRSTFSSHLNLKLKPSLSNWA